MIGVVVIIVVKTISELLIISLREDCPAHAVLISVWVTTTFFLISQTILTRDWLIVRNGISSPDRSIVVVYLVVFFFVEFQTVCKHWVIAVRVGNRRYRWLIHVKWALLADMKHASVSTLNPYFLLKRGWPLTYSLSVVHIVDGAEGNFLQRPGLDINIWMPRRLKWVLMDHQISSIVIWVLAVHFDAILVDLDVFIIGHIKVTLMLHHFIANVIHKLTFIWVISWSLILTMIIIYMVVWLTHVVLSGRDWAWRLAVVLCRFVKQAVTRTALMMGQVTV